MEIHGRTFGSAPRASISLDDFDRMRSAALFGEDDIAVLRRSHDVVAPQTDAILDVWYGFVGSLPHLLASFSFEGVSGAAPLGLAQARGPLPKTPRKDVPDGACLAAVRKRFGQWILDAARAEYDQRWLDYQFEIGRRHHRVGTNRTDGAKASPIVELRYLLLCSYP